MYLRMLIKICKRNGMQDCFPYSFLESCLKETTDLNGMEDCFPYSFLECCLKETTDLSYTPKIKCQTPTEENSKTLMRLETPAVANNSSSRSNSILQQIWWGFEIQ